MSMDVVDGGEVVNLLKELFDCLRRDKHAIASIDIRNATWDVLR